MKTSEQLVRELLTDLSPIFELAQKDKNKVTVYLAASVLKATRISNAVLLLCSEGFAEEAQPLLRTLIELTVNARWIMHEDTEKRLSEFTSSLTDDPWFGRGWTDVNLKSRMTAIGFNTEAFKRDGKDYYQWVLKPLADYSHSNASSLPLADIVANEQKTRMSSEAMLQLAIQFLGHLMIALDQQWPGKFSRSSTAFAYILAKEARQR